MRSRGVEAKLEAASGEPLPAVGRPAGERRGLRQSVLSLADQGVASLANFATGVLVARGCTKEGFGLYMLGITVILLLTDLQGSLIATPYMVYAPRLRGEERGRYSGSTLLHQALLSLLTVAVLAVAAVGTMFGLGPRGLEPVMWALSGTVGIIMLREFARRICFARLEIGTALVLDTACAVVQLGSLAVLGRLHLLTTPRVFGLMGAVCGLVVALWLWWERETFRPRVGRAISDGRRNWLVGKWVFLSGLLWTGSTNIYPWLLASFHGTAAAGVFAACLGVVSASNPLLLGVQNLVGPRVAHEYAAHGPAALRRLVLRITALLAVPVTVVTVALMVWGDRLIGLLYGHRYAGNAAVVKLLALNLLVTALAFAYSRALFAVERADLDFGLNVATVVIMATAGVWLVRLHGPLGAACGLLVANVVTSLARAVLFLALPERVPAALREEAHA